MRFLGLTALCLAVSLSGIYVSLLRKKKLKVLSVAADFFFELAESVRLRYGDIISCIDIICSREGSESLDFIFEIKRKYTDGCNIKKVWSDCVRESSSVRGLPVAARELLLAFGDNLGKLPSDGFCEKCRMYSDALRKLAITENDKWEKNRTLIMSSGVLCAAAVFFILI